MATKSNEKTWQLQTAKSRFSTLVNRALTGEPQLVTKNGKPAVYIISVKNYEALKGTHSLKKILLNSPHKEIEISLERDDDTGRNIAL